MGCPGVISGGGSQESRLSGDKKMTLLHGTTVLEPL